MIRNAFLIVGLGLTLAACNTVAGIGEDISSGARTVQDTF